MSGCRDSFRLLLLILGSLLLNCSSPAQNSGTGAITGIVSDPSGAAIPGASVSIMNLATGETRRVVSSGQGVYAVQLLLPGHYEVEVAKNGFGTSTFSNVAVNVTETTTLNAKLAVGSIKQTVSVDAAGQLLQTDSSTLGALVTGEMVQSLPLVTRNYTQIIGLSPGVSTNLTNAGALGRGDGGGSGSDSSRTGIVSAGTSWSDNNFQMNGVEINDLQGSGNFSGGIAVPNPDTIAEFKVQTSQYDASYGRNSGANVNLVTKSGSNQFHGAIFEFFRNEALNANDYFLNQQDQLRPILRQNQPGFTFGGPIKKSKLTFFTSYQATRQTNGIDPDCSSSFFTPPLTNDRSKESLGALFAGQPTFIQQLTGAPIGPNVLSDGSNISPQALALFNLKLPNGQYLIPTPQRVDSSQPFDSQGVSSISQPCIYNEDQFMTNADWLQSVNSTWQARFFFANSTQTRTLPAANLGGPTVPGFPVESPNRFRNFTLANSHIFSQNLLNQAEFGYHRQYVNTVQKEAFKYSDIGAQVPSFDDSIPEVFINGGVTLGGNGQGLLVGQNTFVYQDSVSWIRGKHAFRFGGGVTHAQDNQDEFHYVAGLLFFSFPDILLGQSGIQNGTGVSNIYGSIDLPGLFNREFRTTDANVYVQDDYKITQRLTLNLGFRYDRLGDISDGLGRLSNFYTGLANPNPPASGTYEGFVVSSNYKGSFPAGVTRLSTDSGIDGIGQNTLNPRVGFAWQFPGTTGAILRGGYGIYHQKTTGQPIFQLLTNAPFSELRENLGPANTQASWANPLPAFADTLPSFVSYSPTTALSLFAFAHDFRPPTIQHYDLNTQVELGKRAILEIGYIGTRGIHLIVVRLPNQASLASAANPIRGVTNNTLQNVQQRVLIEGFGSSSLNQIESTGISWYNALTASLTKPFTKGLEFQASYTWARDLSNASESATGKNGGIRLGDQNNPRANYGPDDFIRSQRFIANFVYEIPTPFKTTSFLRETLGGWKGAGVITVQSGGLLTVTNTNALSVYGINKSEGDFAEVAPGCTRGEINTPGSVEHKLHSYINQSCFISPRVIGDDRQATGFGNSRPGIVSGTAQRNVDFALIKLFPVSWPNESAHVEFRTELFNAFNTPQFDNPNTASDQSTFGWIQRTIASPRIMQFALKLSF